MMNNKVKKLYHRIALNNNLSDQDVQNIVESQFEFIKEKISELSFEGIKTEEDFKKIKTNFMLKYIGKFYTNFNIVNNIRKKKITAKNNNKKRWKKSKT